MHIRKLHYVHCRPSRNQRELYNGHKRAHGLKFQTVMCPDGIIASVYGPTEGRRHDITLYRLSGVETILQNIFALTGGITFGDLAYPNRPWLQCPFKGANLTNDQL